MKKYLSLFILFLSFCYIYAQKVKSYSIKAEFFPHDAQMYGYPVSSRNFMRGRAKIKFSGRVDIPLAFYLHGELKMDSIKLAGQRIAYDSKKILFSRNYSRVALKTVTDTLIMAPHDNIKIYYSGFFNPSRARSLSDYMRIDQGEGVFLRSYGYSIWFPVFIETGQETYQTNFKEVSLKLHGKFKAVVAGQKIRGKYENGVTTSIWRPGKIDIFDLQCTARDYQIKNKGNIYIYYLEGQHSQAKIDDILNFALKIKNFYSRKFRQINQARPLYIMAMPRYGNISNANVIGLSPSVLADFNEELSARLTIAHELVHPYVKIPISRRDSLFALVVEGFPGFFHLYGLARVLDKKSFNLEEYMDRIEKGYLRKRQTGQDRRKNNLPPAKTITSIKADEIGSYKDKYILNDRVRLFLYDLLKRMGGQKHDDFLNKLFNLERINYVKFKQLILQYLPDYRKELSIWLNQTAYPEKVRLENY